MARLVLHENASLSCSRIVNVDLSDSEFSDVNLQGVDFEDVQLAAARLVNVNLSQSSIQDAALDGMRINGILVTALLRVYSPSRGKE